MTHMEARLSLQLMAEERVGADMRAAARQERAAEDAAAAQVRSAAAQEAP